uniref:Uncharacterized protein n=1 Tax=Peronospora matthiolae TaxID=2874970 RepID=A0AAV1UT02_9STRA
MAAESGMKRSTTLLRSLNGDAPRKAQKALAEDEKGKRWTPDQDNALRQAVEEFGQRNWKAIASRVDGRNHAQCLQRWNKVLKPGLVKGHWAYEEDSTLEHMVLQGCHSWGEVATYIPGRTAKQCRERWRNHLDPSINKFPFTLEEDKVIQDGFRNMGNRWTQIAELLPGRTEDAVKMRWKVLNPNEKVKAKPGRPKLMPGMTANKQRSAIPPPPDDVVATLINRPTMTPAMAAYEDKDCSGPVFYQDDGVTSGSMPSLDPLQTTMPYVAESLPTVMAHHYLEPIIEPLSDEAKAETETKDAVMLRELLRSHSNSLLSFGSLRGLDSFADMSPEDLLASGELDEMFRATVSISKDKCERSRLSSTSSVMDTLTSSFKNPESLQKAMQNLDHEDQHLFQGLIDSWRAQVSSDCVSASEVDDQIASLPVGPDAYLQCSFETSSGRNMARASGTEETHSFSRRNANGISYELGNITSDIDDLLDSDLMRPIIKGRLC